MASSTVGFKSREDHRKQLELEEARKAGLAPAEVDEEGNEINPHIPQYMASAPWYLNASAPSLKHQRNWKTATLGSKDWYDRGAKTFQAVKYRKGACENCGAMTHKRKDCTERPRQLGAKVTNRDIAPDEKIQNFELDFEGKRDRWNGYDPSTYARVIDLFAKTEEIKRKNAKARALERKFKKDANKKDKKEKGEGEEDKSSSSSSSDDEGSDDEADDAKVDESQQMDFAKVEKRVRTTGGGSTGTVRNLRIREDTAKYLRNLDVNSAHYDPKTRSMREDPTPDVDPNEKFFAGDNFERHKGQSQEFQALTLHSIDAFEKGQDVHLQSMPSQAELLYREFKAKKEKLKDSSREVILSKYGNAAATAMPEDVAVLAQTEQFVVYDRAGRVVKGQEKPVARSKYEEDVYDNNHTAVWGSYWRDGQWGYACCKQLMKNTYCTGAAGREAEQAAADLLRGNMEKRQAAQSAAQKDTGKGPMKAIAWGRDVEENLELDPAKLAAALEKEDANKFVESDDRKRKYNVRYDTEVTPEEMEAYRMRRTRADDPMLNMKDTTGEDEDA
eukprot:jgi/Mesvir1/5140/Mv15286-RA.1